MHLTRFQVPLKHSWQAPSVHGTSCRLCAARPLYSLPSSSVSLQRGETAELSTSGPAAASQTRGTPLREGSYIKTEEVKNLYLLSCNVFFNGKLSAFIVK